jgi:anaerobic selenocysteine-containing dehydrogenase
LFLSLAHGRERLEWKDDQMINGLTRRDFLKVGTLAATATVVSGCTINLQRTETLESYVQPPEDGLPGENLWYASTCRQCSAGCGIVVRTSEGRARKVEGNRLHPVNRGKLCARGQAALQELYDPDRLRGATSQKGGRGSAAFEQWYWSDLIPTVSGWITAAGPDAVAFLGGNTSTHLTALVRRFLDALGAPPPVFYTLGDEMEGRQALLQSTAILLGSTALPFFDLGQADVVFSFGANFLETWLSPVQYSQAYGQMRSRALGKRGYFVQFESRYSSTAACADEWVPLQPGSEGLVALALGKILVDEGLAAPPAGGPSSALYAQVDVAAVAQASGVPTAELERLAHILGAVSTPLAIPGGSLATYGNGAASLTAIGALNVLLSRLGQPGGVYLPPAAGDPDLAWLLPSPPADLQSLIQRMAAGQVQVLFIHGANPVFELPPSLGFADALNNVQRVISFNPAVDETALQADLLLPDHTNLESWGYYVPALADRVVTGALQPVVQPLYDTRATADVLLALAQEMGGTVAQQVPWPNEVEFLKEVTAKLAPAGTSADLFWSQWRRQGGIWPQAAAWNAPSSALALDQPLTAPQPAVAGDQLAYPYTLHLYPSITLFDGRGANKSWLQETPDPMTTVAWQTWIEIHPNTAARLGLQDGDLVTVSSQSGAVEALVYVYPGLLEDVVAMPLGQGHEQYGRYAHGQGSNPIQLLPPGSGSALSGVRVSLQPSGQKKALARLESPDGIEYLLNEF